MRVSLLLMTSSTNLLNRCFNYVIDTSAKFNIDESHALKHSMKVFGTANKIYDSEVKKFPYLKTQKSVIYSAAIGHDMCDKKYMNESNGIIQYQSHLSNVMTTHNLDAMGRIISTMSYSKVKENGYPNLENFQLSYHIVREADLLAAYDIDRCIIYGIYRENKNYIEALQRAIDLFENRIFTMRSDDLFITSYSKCESLRLHKKAKIDVENLLRSLH